MNKDFSAFDEDKIYKIQREAKKGRDLYFAIYQAIAEDNFRPGLYKEYNPDYFDFIIVDECHRGSARDESSWRIPVSLIVNLVANGQPFEEILEEYPDLELDDIKQSLQYAALLTRESVYPFEITA
jgi:hypothetical protein